ncbi:MAG: hypothetical protein WC792_02160 [Candidatus Micrarchaeia archaeon]|jgi:hypothetical protein
MVLKCEANCPRCFTKTDYIYPLNYDKNSRKFTCSHDPSHVFVEDERGYLKSQ